MDRILVLEEEPTSRDALSAHLGARGFEVRTARTASDAIELAREWDAHVILRAHAVDPGARPNTYAGEIRLLRQAEPTALLPIVQLVPRELAQLCPHLLDAGADDCAIHPVEWPALLLLLHARAQSCRRVYALHHHLVSETRTRVYSTVSRDFFTPLLEIEAHSEYLKHRPSCDADTIADIAQQIVDAAQSLRTLLGALAHAATMESAGPQEGAEQTESPTLPVDSDALVSEAATRAARSLGRENDLRLALASAACSIPGAEFQTMVEEAVASAARLSPPGSALLVTSASDGDYVLTVRCTLQAGAGARNPEDDPEAGVSPLAPVALGLGTLRRLAANRGGSVRLRRGASPSLAIVLVLPPRPHYRYVPSSIRPAAESASVPLGPRASARSRLSTF